jgi:hypothetical protein
MASWRLSSSEWNKVEGAKHRRAENLAWLEAQDLLGSCGRDDRLRDGQEQVCSETTADLVLTAGVGHSGTGLGHGKMTSS